MTEWPEDPWLLYQHIVGSEPVFWRRVAADLLHASDAIEPAAQDYWNMWAEKRHDELSAIGNRRGGHKVVLLLRGLAVENLLKALIIGRLPEAERWALVKSGELTTSLTKHDLAGLARAADFPVTPEIAALLLRLQEAVVWSGRYPMPKRASGGAPPSQPEYRNDLVASRELSSVLLALVDNLWPGGANLAPS
jgi:hypothetical protein